MAVIGTILKEVVKIKKQAHDKKQLNFELQAKVLQKILSKAKNTGFGRHYKFGEILNSKDRLVSFRHNVPIFDYEKLYVEWWHKLLEGNPNVTWPGKVKYFGLTSGTSNDASKRVPVTRDMIIAMRKIGIRQLLALSEFDLPPDYYQKSVLMVGGSTNLVKMQDYFEGDLSGILASKLPFWFDSFYKPGKISKERDWNLKLDKIVKAAPAWDIGGIAGVPAWVQILIERIIDHYGLKNIHEIWPNFVVYAHGGVSFEPYRKSFDKLLGKPIYYLETYLASEGFLAYQKKSNSDMQMVLDNGIFFEFVPFNNSNFTPDGKIVDSPQVLNLKEVQEGKDYAILLTTVAGAWRYLIGDTIRFTNLANYEIIITGRTKHFLSLCGEHLSVDNMTKAINMVSQEFNIDIKEFTVAGIHYENLFAHHWFISSNKPGLDAELIATRIDKALKALNDDYATERKAALKRVMADLLPESAFYDWMRAKGKEGGQHKFPRVINSIQYSEWSTFVQKYKNSERFNLQ